MRQYSVYGTRAISSSGTIATIGSVADAIPHIFEILLSTSDTPSDTNINMQVARSTTAGGTIATGGVITTPVPMDPGGIAANTVAYNTFTGSPTYDSTPLLKFSFNAQVTFRWVVPPSEGIIIAVDASDGVGVDCTGRTSGTPNVETTILFDE